MWSLHPKGGRKSKCFFSRNSSRQQFHCSLSLTTLIVVGSTVDIGIIPLENASLITANFFQSKPIKVAATASTDAGSSPEI